MSGAAMVAAARTALGARFRLHGRTIADGLDCVGLIAIALAGAGYRGTLPTGYALRTGDMREVERWVARVGLNDGAGAPGEVLLARAGAGQLHLAIDAGASVIHADAWLRRVVELPGPAPWPVLRRWRYQAD